MILADLITEYGVDVLAHLDRQADIPVLSAPQAQGDVSILPVTAGAATTPIPASEGVTVAVGTNDGLAHVLLPGGGFFDPARGGDELEVGTLTVPPGGVAWLAHPRHGFNGIAPGTYRIGRQREWRVARGGWQIVAD